MVLSSILKSKNVNDYLELDERRPINLIRSKYTNNIDYFMYQDSIIVNIVDSLPINKTKLTLKVDMDSCNQKKSNFMFYSPIENAEVNGLLIKKDKKWLTKINSDIEF